MFNYRATLVVSVVFIVSLAAAACAAPSSTPAPTAPIPTTAPAAGATPTAGATSGAEGNVATGKALFEANCNGCHPGGQKGVGPDIRGKEEDVVKRQVRRGGGGMPAFSTSQISDQQLNDIAAYVESLK